MIEITDEMVEAALDAHEAFIGMALDADGMRAALAVVAPMIAAAERARLEVMTPEDIKEITEILEEHRAGSMLARFEAEVKAIRARGGGP